MDDSNSSSKNISSDKLVLSNIQRSIDLIQLIQEEIESQDRVLEDERNNKKRANINDTENTTTIMQDIDIINKAVSDGVTTSQEDSFLNSM